VPLAVLALVGLLVWWLVSGEAPSDGSGADIAKRAALGIGVLIACGAIAAGGGLVAGLGGGTVVASLVIVAGVMLVAGSFIGRARWLILPALSLALAVGFVSAAGIDLDGGVGERDYRPASADEVRDGYRLGMGELIVDLRQAELPAGDTRLDLDVGIGAARLIVPEDVCVASAADIGIGAVEVFDRDNGGVDLDWGERPRAAAGNSRVVVDAEIGVGALLVGHDRSDDFDRGPGFGRDFGEDHRDEGGDEMGNAGCRQTRAAR
ncbi:MAG: cell wall-active antibiotics response protein, partial [Actinomycetota bacterium]|nr:cell wall-active antibiotics response protein [Actinomycetota bacterium]